MKLNDDSYNASLLVLEQAVQAFCVGDRASGNQLLASLDVHRIEQDRRALLALARTARLSTNPVALVRSSRTIPLAVKNAVSLRDRYHCRFTGRRLIDTRVFQQLGRISDAFHFDEHHSAIETRRGPAGHPMVRTHGAAYEHVDPHSCGGAPTIENICQISVQLNEPKGARVLDLVDVPEDNWIGMTEYLPALSRQSTSKISRKQESVSGNAEQKTVPVQRERTTRKPRVAAKRRTRQIDRIREAASGLAVQVFWLGDDSHAEENFLRLRRTAKNSYFSTETKTGPWSFHRMHCSSLTFTGDQKVTASPKVCADDINELAKWAYRFGVDTVRCPRCPRPK